MCDVTQPYFFISARIEKKVRWDISPICFFVWDGKNNKKTPYQPNKLMLLNFSLLFYVLSGGLMRIGKKYPCTIYSRKEKTKKRVNDATSKVASIYFLDTYMSCIRLVKSVKRSLHRHFFFKKLVLNEKTLFYYLKRWWRWSWRGEKIHMYNFFF